jgi:hypothetical protein
MDEEFYPITRMQPQVVPDGLRDGRLTFARNGRFHNLLSLLLPESNTSKANNRQASPAMTPHPVHSTRVQPERFQADWTQSARSVLFV